jgi:ABC-2 type transport system permease protein
VALGRVPWIFWRAAAGPDDAVGRRPRSWDFVRLKLRLLRNGMRARPLRALVFVFSVLFGLWFGLLAFVGLAASGQATYQVGYGVASLTGSILIVAWTLVPLLFFGVDETLDPARFALLPVGRATLARGMLAAAFVGMPAVAALIASAGLVVAALLRFGPLTAIAAGFGVLAGLVLAVVASRAVISAFAGLLRSRRVRDLAAVLIAVIASSAGLVQFILPASGGLDRLLPVARVLAWTPLGAPYVLPFDVAAGNLVAAGLRLAMTLTAIGLLLWWWSLTIESAMLARGDGARTVKAAVAGQGAVAGLLPALVRPTVFGAILARELRFWWRDPRRRANLISALIASALVPVGLVFAAGRAPRPGDDFPSADVVGATTLAFAVVIAGTLAGLVLANQFAFDGSAFAAHLLARVAGRTELRARVAAIAVIALPLQLAVFTVVTWGAGRPAELPASLGELAASFGASTAASGLVSVFVPFALPESSNPFSLNSGGSSIKALFGVVAMLATFVIASPVLVLGVVVGRSLPGSFGVLLVGVAYAGLTIWLGTMIGGAALDRRGPEVLRAVTPRR